MFEIIGFGGGDATDGETISTPGRCSTTVPFARVVDFFELVELAVVALPVLLNLSLVLETISSITMV